MLSVLVVEDDENKLRRVNECLSGVIDPASGSIDHARDALSAKRMMKEHQYDLLILDIAIPDLPDTPPLRNGGIALLDQIFRRDIYKTPRHIIGLTAYDDVLEESSPRFTEDLLLILFYDPSSEIWARQLQRKIYQIYLTEQANPSTSDYLTQLCIVTALHDPELKAVLSLPWNWEKRQLPNDYTVYNRGYYSRSGRTYEVIAAAAPRMGMTWSAVLTTKMITAFRPKYVAMAGILAGIRGQCELGDVIVADPSWDYGSGKYLPKDDITEFAASPYQIGLSTSLRGKLSLLAQDSALLDSIRSAWQGPSPRSSLSVLLGPVASGAAVLASSSMLDKVKDQHRKVIGIEMETYGVLSAVEESTRPQPVGFSMKSVCDFADEEKNDNYRHYAAFTSAMALRAFVEKHL